MTEIPVGVHHLVPHFTSIPRRASQRTSADDNPGTDAAFAPQTDEVIRAAARSTRVLRGGGYTSLAKGCRSAVRDSREPEYRNTINGFRVVLASLP